MKSFVSVSVVEKKGNVDGETKEVLSISPDFRSTGKDIMTKGGNFYAILDPKTNLWETNESRAIEIIDQKLYSYRDSHFKEDGYGNYTNGKCRVIVECLDSSKTNQLYLYRKWVRSLPTNHNYHQLDSDITFVGEEIKPEMYRSKRLKYEVKEGSIFNYDKLISKLYSEENRQKLEWAIGSIFCGDSKKIEKFMVLYGDKGTGKSTVLDLIKELFEGYYGVFVAADLANKANQFSTEAFKDNPLVSIQDDGTLAKIDSPLINEIVSHKEISVNEKNTKHYTMKMNTFLILATNEKVDIHDTKMGITRRLLDVYPTGDKFPVREYRELVHNLKFELGAIAFHCMEVYKSLGKEYYLNYIPEMMIDKTNYLRNFIFDNYDKFISNDYFIRDILYKWYKEYCDESGIQFIQKRIDFGEQMIEYFEHYDKIKWIDGQNRKHVYTGFKEEKFNGKINYEIKDDEIVIPEWLKLKKRTYGALDLLYPDSKAQYATDDGKPIHKWSEVNTTLKEIFTNKLHFVKVPENLIVIDFDIKDENGEKSLDKNLKAASKWPPTYAELSKSGEGIHLHYIYNGDISKLKILYDKDIEIKTFRGNASLRRLVSKCNSEEIAIISSGLPEKGEKVVNEQSIKDERHLRALIAKALRKEVFPNTKPCMDFILTVTDKAYKNGVHYDITDMRPDIQVFANNSSHQADYCLRILNEIHFQSDEVGADPMSYEYDEIIFYDVEIFPNLFVVCWKIEGEGKKIVKMINPSSADIEELCKHKLVGFNNRNYDNHMLYARIMGYSIYQLYDLSTRIIGEQGRNAKFSEAYKLSYTDIYDYAAKKQSLKKWEIELGIHHQELGMRWNEPVPKEKWEEVAGYCANDVIATEAVWNATKGDFLAREILADLSGLTVNATTNQCTTRIIVGDSKNPQNEFIYTDLSTIYPGYKYNSSGVDKTEYNEGAKIVSGKSLYLGEDPGEGGYVYAEPGIYKNVGLLDVASMHPHSAIRLNIFGDRYTKRFADLVEARIFIKRGEFEKAGNLLDGALKPYLKDKSAAKQLAQALKIAINSVYGLTSAKFDNKLRDPRNKDNIVAKYGALFMINLKHEVQNRGYIVVHIKTDSIKIANMDDKIMNFCMEYAKEYGYEFEHEATYEKFCLVNESTYIAKDKSDGHWTATGTQFQVPYVFKTLFSHEPITFDDECETKSVTTALYLDLNEGMKGDEHVYKFVGRVGQFTPVRDGAGGGILVREASDKDGNIKYNSVTGTKKPGGKSVYRWLESEQIRELNLYDAVDTSYFNNLVEAAVDTINKFGSFREFVSDEIPDWLNVPEGLPEEIPFPMNPPQ